ncbi:MAG: tryptophan synthase subunit alpha [Nitrospirae bacterium]|nr:tryptophan synthase subunit alpha [Nitrospirota bacterium]
MRSAAARPAEATANRIDDVFARLRGRDEKALIPYVMAGDPDVATTEEWLLAAASAGADLLEIGVPFSDPLADGPVLQRAAERALAQHVTLGDVLGLARRVRAKTPIPLILMTYYNLIFQYGDERLARDAAAAGVDGLIVPDLPPEEADTLAGATRAAGVHLIFLVAPTTPPARIAAIAARASGFLYYVSLTGITGSKLPPLEEIEQRVRAIKRTTRLPVAVGFGVSTPDEAARIARVADGVIVASALIKRLQEEPDPSRRSSVLTAYVASLKQALIPR